MATIVEHDMGHGWVEKIEVFDKDVDGKYALSVGDEIEGGSIDLSRDELIRLRDAIDEILKADGTEKE